MNNSNILLLFFILQFYIVQIIVSLEIQGYSWSYNTVSELGDKTRSPKHKLVNISFIITGIFTVIGAFTIRKHTGLASTLFLSGLGGIIVGAYPSDCDPTLHFIGGGMNFVFGNLSLFFLGRKLPCPASRFLCNFAGTTGLLSAYLFLKVKQQRGLVERLALYPQALVLSVFALAEIKTDGKLILS